MENKICTQCGHKNNLSANFCKSCGTPLTDVEKSAEQKAEEVKQKLKETANSVKQTSKDGISTFFILIKPVLKAKIIIPIVVIILSVVFWDNIVHSYEDYQYNQKLAKERKAEEVEKKAKKERLAREKKAEDERIAIERKAEEERIEREKKEAWDSREVFVDKSTGLIWQDDKNTKIVKIEWDDAVDYCKRLEFAGFSDWSLPSKNELEELYTKKDNLKYGSSYYYWSSSENVSGSSKAWGISFYSGDTYYYNKSGKYYIRCVRGRQ